MLDIWKSYTAESFFAIFIRDASVLYHHFQRRVNAEVIEGIFLKFVAKLEYKSQFFKIINEYYLEKNKS